MSKLGYKLVLGEAGRPPPSIKSKADRETPSVTPIRGPLSMELGSGKVAGKVLIVEHV